MKKIILFTFSAFLLAGVSAQQKLKTNFIREKGNTFSSTSNLKTASGNLNPMAVNGGIVCNSSYLAGTTMDLSFTLTTTTSDGEYIDSLSLTFPANFLINGTNATPTFPTDDNGGGDELYNGINGQDITWGSNVGNTDNYGGISADNGETFTINVTIGAGVTGPQTINFFAKGDEFPGTVGGTNGDLIGSVIVMPATTADLRALAADIPNGCGLSTTEPVTVWVKNMGTAPATGFSLYYNLNGTVSPTEIYSGPALNFGDTLMYTFTNTIDMSATNSYDLWAVAVIAGDGNTTDDSVNVMSNSLSPLTFPYATSFEPMPATDLQGWIALDADGGGLTWAINTGAYHSGAQSLRVVEGGAGVSDDWLFSPCADLVMGNTYKITYWKRMTAGFDGDLGVFMGMSADVAGMSTNIQATAPVTPAGQWLNDSVTFLATGTGTYFFGFEGVNTNGTATISLRLDDINITDLGIINSITKQTENVFSIYPNPSAGIFTMNLPNNNSFVEVFNVLGEKVFSKSQLLKGANTIDLSNLAVGNYMLRVLSNNEFTTKKITINK